MPKVLAQAPSSSRCLARAHSSVSRRPAMTCKRCAAHIKVLFKFRRVQFAVKYLIKGGLLILTGQPKGFLITPASAPALPQLPTNFVWLRDLPSSCLTLST